MANNMVMFCLLVTLAFLSAVSGADLNKLQMELELLKQEIAELKKEREVRNGICQIKKHPCGDCLCIKDNNLVEKHFCDCRMRSARRDCKEHNLLGERINGLYKIHSNINGHQLQVFCDQTRDGGG